MSQTYEGTPVACRLRATTTAATAKLKSNLAELVGSSKPSAKLKSSSKPSKEKPMNNTKMEAEGGYPELSEELKPLAKYFEFLQKKSQDKFTTTVVESVESCKVEIRANMNEMIESIKSSVNDIKSNFKQLETKVDEKIGKMQEDITKVECKVDKSRQEVSEVKQLQANYDIEKEQLKEQVQIMKEEISSLKNFKEKVEAQLVGLRGDVDRRMDEQETNIKFQREKLDKVTSTVESDLDVVKIRSYGNLNQIRHLTTQMEDMDNKQRANNLIIEGLPEKPDEETKTDLVSLIGNEIQDFQVSMIKTVYRLGKRNEKKKKPRLLLVMLNNPTHRDLILARATEIRKKSNNKFFWINKDQNYMSKRKHAMVKSCYKLLLENKHACSLKGSIITFNNRSYGYESLNLLPEPCTPFYVKSRETEDSKGLCFYSEHTYCSNFHPAKIRYRGSFFTSVEHAYQTLKVKDVGYTELAAEMHGILNPYSLKKIGGDITPAEGWFENSEDLMEELIRAKFEQNPKLRHLLISDKHSEFYEMTADRRWATGVRIKAADKSFDQEKFKGSNLVGLILTKIKKEISPVGEPSPQASEDVNQPNGEIAEEK